LAAWAKPGITGGIIENPVRKIDRGLDFRFSIEDEG
jgi:hypothetical protein